MPNEPQRPRRPGWRNAGQPSAGARPKHAWQRGPGDSAGSARTSWSKRRKLALVGAGFAALATGIVLLVLLIRGQKPPQVEFVFAGNIANLPAPASAYDKLSEEAFLKIDLGNNTTAHSSPLLAAQPEEFDAWLQ